MTNFGKAPIKGEGTATGYDKGMKPSEETLPTTWIEFSLPAYLEDECWKMIERWLKKKGVKDD